MRISKSTSPDLNRADHASSAKSADAQTAAETNRPKEPSNGNTEKTVPDHGQTADLMARAKGSSLSKLMTSGASIPQQAEVIAHQARSGDVEGAARAITAVAHEISPLRSQVLMREVLASQPDLMTEFEKVLQDLESQEQLGNMEIQDLMSRYNQAEQLAGSTFKKKDDADLAIINKI